jgi:PEP-CTERM motif
VLVASCFNFDVTTHERDREMSDIKDGGRDLFSRIGATGYSVAAQGRRSSFTRFLLPCMAASLALLAAGASRASTFTVTLAQVGPDVVATGSGSIDLTGLTSFGSGFANNEMYPDHGIIGVGPTANKDQYSGESGPFSFGPGGAAFPSTWSGDAVSLEDFGLGIDVPAGYVSGTSLSGSATFASTTLGKLGLTSGTYTWTWNNGTDDFVIQVPTFRGNTPEPETWALMLAGVGMLGASLRAARGRGAPLG